LSLHLELICSHAEPGGSSGLGVVGLVQSDEERGKRNLVVSVDGSKTAGAPSKCLTIYDCILSVIPLSWLVLHGPDGVYSVVVYKYTLSGKQLGGQHTCARGTKTRRLAPILVRPASKSRIMGTQYVLLRVVWGRCDTG
jgi:hypothetical protein